MIYKKIIFKCNSNSSWFENASLRVQSASFLILGKAAQCIKFGKMVLITIDGKVTQSLQSGVWSEDFVLPFEPAYNTTWIGRISDYDQGLINANISVSFKSIKIRPTMDINVDHLIRFQIMYPCK